MSQTRSHRFSLKFFRVIWEEGDSKTAPELAPRVNRQLSQATERNRIKRILREFFRGHPDFFKKGRWVFIAKQKIEQVPNHEVFNDLERIFKLASAA